MDGEADIWAMKTVDEVRTEIAEECWEEWLACGGRRGSSSSKLDGWRHRMRVTVAHDKCAGRSCLEAQLGRQGTR
jgi:hypothetical protein